MRKKEKEKEQKEKKGEKVKREDNDGKILSQKNREMRKERGETAKPKKRCFQKSKKLPLLYLKGNRMKYQLFQRLFHKQSL